MSEQFVNVFKANKHIVALDTQLATVTAERDDLKTKLATAEATIAAYDPTIEATAAQLQTDLTQARTDLATARLSITSLTTERDQANAKLANQPAAIAAAASVQAQQITAAQGQPPVAVTPATAPGGIASNVMKRADFEALTPGEKQRFMRNGGKLTE